MPCATIHMLTAGRILSFWEEETELAPFPVRRPALRRAFLLGAMGPDMGFIPGVDRFVSELAHYVRTGDLTRALLREARDVEQEAFAWGWAAHHQTDVEIHPLVGRACGEHLHGDRDLRLNSSDDLYTHVAMEVGLDLVFFVNDPSIPLPPRSSSFRGSRLGFLHRALESTYAVEWRPDDLDRSHQVATRRTARWPSALRMVAAGRGFAPLPELGRIPRLGRRAVEGLLDLAGAVVDPEGAPAGFLDPLRPPDWMIREVEETARAFPRRFQRAVNGRLADLDNRNLETGLEEEAPVDHPDSEATRERLQRLEREAHGSAPLPR